jgi:hypothetical protein
MRAAYSTISWWTRSSEGDAPASAIFVASLSWKALTAPGSSGSASSTSAAMASRRSRNTLSSLAPLARAALVQLADHLVHEAQDDILRAVGRQRLVGEHAGPMQDLGDGKRARIGKFSDHWREPRAAP